MSDVLLTEIRGPAAILTMNRPEKSVPEPVNNPEQNPRWLSEDNGSVPGF